MIKIGDFSRLNHISIRMLRYYDQHNLLKPAYVDKISGYRYYSAEQVSKLQKIKLLRDLGFSVNEIKEMFYSWTDEVIISEFNRRKKNIETEMNNLKEQKDRIDLALADANTSKFHCHYNVSIKEVPAMNVIFLRKKIPTHFDEGILWKELDTIVQKNNISIVQGHYNNIAIYHDTEHLEKNVDVEVAFVLSKELKETVLYTCRYLEGIETMAYMMVYGPYEKLTDAYKNFIYWLDEHPQYEMYGQFRQVTIIDPTQTKDPNGYLTEIQIPIRESVNRL